MFVVRVSEWLDDVALFDAREDADRLVRDMQEAAQLWQEWADSDSESDFAPPAHLGDVDPDSRGYVVEVDDSYELFYFD